MGLFKRKDKNLIPPVGPPSGGPASDPYARRGSPAQGGDPYASGAHRDPYAAVNGDRARGVSQHNPYARNGDGQGGGGGGGGGFAPPSGDNDAMRNELLGGFQAPQRSAPKKDYLREGAEQEEDFDEDEEVEGIKQEMRETKMDSLASTRDTLRLAREAEETARGTMARLGDQSESLANSERYLDVAKANSMRAEDKTAELKQLNRSIFRPVVVWNKDAKRAAQEEKIQQRHLMEREDRLSAMKDVQASRQVLGAAARGGMDPNATMAGRQAQRAAERKRYQVDATQSDDELEDELADNLDETYEITKRLNALAKGMGTEVDNQNKRIGRITDKTDNLDIKVQLNTSRLANIK